MISALRQKLWSADEGAAGVKTSGNQWLLALLLITAFGGALRKWVVESSAISNGILGIQMILPFLMFVARPGNAVSPFSKHSVLYVYFFYLVIQIINPLQLTFFHGLFGTIIHGGFWIGIFYYLSNRHLFNPTRLMYLILLVAIIEVVLAFVQYNLPQTHFLNKYAREEQMIAVVGDRVRVTGTFSYLSGYTAYMLFYPFMVWAMFRLRFPQWVTSIAIIFGVAVAFMTGSRGATLLTVVMFILILFREYPIQRIIIFISRLTIPLAVGVAILLVVNQSKVLNQIELAYDNFMSRVEANQRSGEQQRRIESEFFFFDFNRFQYPVFGIGTGSTYQGAQALFGISQYVWQFGYIESEQPRILLEGGWILYLLRWWLILTMASLLSFKGLLRIAVIFLIAIGQPIVFNPHNAAFMLLGIILVDNVIWRQSQVRQQVSEPVRQRVEGEMAEDKLQVTG